MYLSLESYFIVYFCKELSSSLWQFACATRIYSLQLLMFLEGRKGIKLISRKKQCTAVISWL